MSTQPVSISRATPSDVGLDYSALLTQGTALVQELTGAIWTNYNYSDPGVTILEQLCYALTELAYRADFPVQDLLGAQGSGQIDLLRQGLYPARSIMPVNPVTAMDFRRLIIDRVAEVRNTWFTPVPASEAAGVCGLYRIAVLLPPKGCGCECECECHHPHGDAVVKQVLKRYGAHRALCEDVQACEVLKTIPTGVFADVHLDDHSDPDTVLAQLLFALGLSLTPEPKRTSLKAQIDVGRTTSEIFNGPLMLRGFITDDQLMPLPRQVSVEGLLAIMVETPGVLSVDDLTVRVGDSPHARHPGDVIDIPDGCILTLESQSRMERGTLRLFYDGVVCHPNPDRVKRLLERAWAAHRQTYPLWTEYGEAYRPPSGKGADLSAYTSVQTQFPPAYGIGAYGLPSDVGPTRDAQAKQLKGYLMPFDQLMADYFSQLAFVRNLFSINAGGDKTYAWQSLLRIVPDVAPLLAPSYETGMAALIASTDPVAARQSAVLDFLLSFYAESLARPSPAVGDSHTRSVQHAERLKAKQTLLTKMVPATRDRGRGFNYGSVDPQRGMAGLEVRCRIELALLDDGTRRIGVEVTDDLGEVTFGQLLPPATGEALVHTFLPIEVVDRGPEFHTQAGLSLLTGRQVAAQLLPALANPARYRVGTLPLAGPMCLVCQDILGHWWWLEDCRDVAQAVEMTEQLVAAAVNGEERRLYIVEWILLRDGASDHDPSDFSFRVSAVMAAHDDSEPNHGWRRQARAIVRDNMPAHVVVEDVFLGPHLMHRFVRLYEEWVQALHKGAPTQRAHASRRLARFLRPTGMQARPDVAPTPAQTPTDAVAIQTLPSTVSTREKPSHPEASAPVEPVKQTPEDSTPIDSAKPPASIPVLAPTRPVPDKKWWQFWRKNPSAPSLPGLVQAAPPRSKGFDTNTKLTPGTAQAFVADGFTFVVRYLTRNASESGHDLSASEAADILQAGLALMAVQHPLSESQSPSTPLGTQHGQYAAANARSVGLPPGVSIWMDLEGLAASTHPSAVIDYCNAWYASVVQAGYLPGLYVGAGSILTSDALYSKLLFQRYWQSGSRVPDVSTRGYCMMQTIRSSYVLNGVVYDLNFIRADHMGDTPFWLKRNTLSSTSDTAGSSAAS